MQLHPHSTHQHNIGLPISSREGPVTLQNHFRLLAYPLLKAPALAAAAAATHKRRKSACAVRAQKLVSVTEQQHQLGEKL